MRLVRRTPAIEDQPSLLLQSLAYTLYCISNIENPLPIQKDCLISSERCFRGLRGEVCGSIIQRHENMPQRGMLSSAATGASMPCELPLLRGHITLDQALDRMITYRSNRLSTATTSVLEIPVQAEDRN